jgi:CelD/BcsL family acetyltransferase involved in cellulose biosynthesis
VATASSPVAARAATASELALDDPRWQTFVRSHPEALAFHRPEWARLLAACYGYRPFALAVLGSDERVVAGLPVLETKALVRRRWIALPFSDSCAPLLDPGVDASAFAATLERARIRAQAHALEVRAPLAGGLGYRNYEAVVHRAELGPDVEALFARLHPSQVQRNIRRAERDGIVVRRGATQADLTRRFYRLQVETRRRLGMPAQPRRFFEALWSYMLEPGHGYLLLAYAGTEPVAGAVFLAGARTMTYKYGASTPAYWRLRPNHLLFWTAMQSACQEGYRWFDFGRSNLSSHGLRAFKAGWAAQEQPLVYTSLTERAPKTGSGRALSIAQAVMRRSPTWVCRASGELFYRYAAGSRY